MTRSLLRFVTLLGALAILPSAWELAVIGQSQIHPSANIDVGSITLTGADGAVVDGDSAVRADVLDLTTTNPLTVAIVDATGAQITSLGGGTQYTEPSGADTTLTGTVAMMEAGGDTAVPLQGTVANGLLVNLGANNAVTVSGVATAANQTTQITSLQLMDNPVGSVAPGTAGTSSFLAGGVYNSTPPTLTNGQQAALQFTSAGALITSGGGGGGGSGAIVDGTAANEADVLDLTNNNPLTVAIVDTSGNQIASFGGGTQYVEGATTAPSTGTVMLWRTTGAALTAASAAQPLPVAIISGAGSGGTALQDGATFIANTTNITPAGGWYESTVTPCVAGDGCVVGLTAGRVQKVIFANADGSLATYAQDYQSSITVTTPSFGPTMMMERTNYLLDIGPVEDQWNHARGNQRGAQWVAIDYGEEMTNLAVVDASAGTEVVLLAGQGTNTRTYVTDLECSNNSATDVVVDVLAGSGGTKMWQLACPAHGGNNRTFHKPLRGVALNQAIYVDASVATAATSLWISVNSYDQLETP